ncbi:MAG: hypothetical protein ACLGG8_04610 [Gammaproteobacteria bacterium]
MQFKFPWFGKSRKTSFEDTQVLELDFLVEEFDDAIADIDDPVRGRIQAALASCMSPKDLWFLRSKVFSLISRHHCERVASERVARLDHKLRFFVENHPDYDAQELPTAPMALQH